MIDPRRITVKRWDGVAYHKLFIETCASLRGEWMEEEKEISEVYVDSFELEFFSKDSNFDFILMINGKPADEFWNVNKDNFKLDIYEFHKSVIQEGNYDLFTCICGIAECAGWWGGIKVIHNQNEIIWHMYNHLNPQRIIITKKFYQKCDDFLVRKILELSQLEDPVYFLRTKRYTIPFLVEIMNLKP